MSRTSAILALLVVSSLLIAGSRGWLPGGRDDQRDPDLWEHAVPIAETLTVDLAALRGAVSFGFQGGEDPRDSSVWAIGRTSRLACTVLKPRTLDFVVELESAADAGDIQLGVEWNGVELGVARIKKGQPETLEFRVAPEMQLLGTNWVALHHTAGSDPSRFNARRKVARYHRIEVRPADNPAESLSIDRAWLDLDSSSFAAPEPPPEADRLVLQTDHGTIQTGDKVDGGVLQAVLLRPSAQPRPRLAAPPHPLPPTSSSPDDAADPLAKSAVIILLDACRADQLGAYGNPSGATPNLDRLARSGHLWSNTYSAAAYTLPSVSTLLTGLHSHSLGPLSKERKLSRSVETVAETFSKAGLKCVAFAGASPYIGRALALERGFQSFFELHHDPVYRDGGCRAPFVARAFTTWLQDLPGGTNYFAYIHFREPHAPYDPAPPWVAAYAKDQGASSAYGSHAWLSGLSDGTIPAKATDLARTRALYEAGLASMDSVFGGVLEAIRGDPHGDSTAVAVIADHGEAFYEHRRMGHGLTVFDETIHIPWILSLPGSLAGSGRGTIVDSLAATVDIAPTMAGLLGISLSRETVGTDQLLVARGQARPPKAVFSHSTDGVNVTSLRTRQFKFMTAPSAHGRLFDVLADPQERRDLERSLPVTRTLLALRLQRFLDAQRLARDARAQEAAPVIDEDSIEALRALGYVE